MRTFADYWNGTLKSNNLEEYAAASLGGSLLPLQQKSLPDVNAFLAGEGPNLVLAGAKGNGKTWLSVAIAQAVAKRHWDNPVSRFEGGEPSMFLHNLVSGEILPVWSYIDWTELVALVNNVENFKLTAGAVASINKLQKAPFLIVDDFGYTRLREDQFARLFGIIDYRWKKNLKTVFITTLVREALIENLNGATVDRMESGITIAWPDAPSQRPHRVVRL